VSPGGRWAYPAPADHVDGYVPGGRSEDITPSSVSSYCASTLEPLLTRL